MITDFGSARIKRNAPVAHEVNSIGRPGEVVDEDVAPGLTSPEIKLDRTTLELTLTGPGFSLRWTAPEVLDDGVQDLPSDMWAIGWICWEVSQALGRKYRSGLQLLRGGGAFQMMTGKLPFDELDRDGLIISRVVKGKLPETREETQLSHVLELCGLMSDCWTPKPVKRVDASTFRRKVRFMVSAIMQDKTTAT